jgi:hypothetical protein
MRAPLMEYDISLLSMELMSILEIACLRPEDNDGSVSRLCVVTGCLDKIDLHDDRARNNATWPRSWCG